METHDDLPDILGDIPPALVHIRQRFETWLQANTGSNFGGELEQQQGKVKYINAIATWLGVRFRCATCSAPAKLHCSKTRKADNYGYFVFKHGGHTHGGDRCLPALELVDIPSDID